MHVLNGSHLWPLLFSRAASVYHGTVSYAAWEGDYFPAGAHVLPIQHLGMDMYAQLHVPADATVAQVTAAWAQKFSGIPAAVLRRTAIDETGIQARRGAYANPSDLTLPGTLSGRVQANWYTAACTIVHRYQLRGVFFWKVNLADNPAHPSSALSTFEHRKGAVAISECPRILYTTGVLSR